MIEDKGLGLKIAVDEEEAFWIKVKEESLKRIEQMKHEITINEAVAVLAATKIREKEKEEAIQKNIE